MNEITILQIFGLSTALSIVVWISSGIIATLSWALYDEITDTENFTLMYVVCLIGGFVSLLILGCFGIALLIQKVAYTLSKRIK